MLKKILDKRNYIIVFIIVILLVWLIWLSLFYKNEPYVESFTFNGETITFTVYDEVDHDQLTEVIESIYAKFEDVNELSGELTEDEEALLEYAKILYSKTDGYVDVTAGELISYLEDDEEYTFETDIENIVIEDGSLVNDISFNFDSVIGSYATNEVLYYFKQNNITKYIVNEDGDIAAGDYYDDGEYMVSISDPTTEEVIAIISLENKAVATRGSSEDFEVFMVNPKTSSTENKYDSVVVIANDNLTANMLANALYLMDLEEGQEFIESYDAEALWTVDGEITKTDGFDDFVQN